MSFNVETPSGRVNCTRCQDGGTISAWSKKERGSGPFIFTCSCHRSNSGVASWKVKRSFPEWAPHHDLNYVPEWVDRPPTYHWLKYADIKGDEFKRRVAIWGRDWLAAMWRELKEDPSITEGKMGDMPGTNKGE